MQSGSTVQIIIPVFRGLDETRRCIHSVLTSNVQTPFRVIVIDDASPEPALSAWLVEMAAQDRRIELLRNDTNRGFVASVNRGMRHAAGHDVLLLNNDTEVSGDWLDRMVRCAYSASDVGTVTPFSDNATICTFPSIAGPRTLPRNLSVHDLHPVFAELNDGESADIPTAVGFCMLIRHDCLEATGLFDEDRFGAGYGEENDFCCRASEAGWRHKLAADVFVHHEGEVSFGESADTRKQRATEIMRALHPDYEAHVRDFIASDPAAPLRQRVHDALVIRALETAACGAGPGLLHIMGMGGGGTARYIDELVSHTAQDMWRQFTLYCRSGQPVLLREMKSGFVYPLNASNQTASDLLEKLIKTLDIRLLHHHVMTSETASLIEAAANMGIAQVCTIHDIGILHPHALDLPAPERTSSLPEGDASWLECMKKALAQMETVIVPSRFLRDLAQPLMAVGSHPVLIPHGRSPLPDRALSSAMRHAIETRIQRAGFTCPRKRIAVVGALGAHKGSAYWKQLLEQTSEAGIEWLLVGYTSEELGPLVRPGLIIHGVFEPDQLHALLDAYQIGLVYFPPGVPEGYSYALSDAWHAGCPVIAHDVGAIGERVQAWPEGGWLIDAGASVEQTAARIKDILDRKDVIRARQGALDDLKSELEQQFQSMIANTSNIWASAMQASSNLADSCHYGVIQDLLLPHVDESLFRKELMRASHDRSHLEEQNLILHEEIKGIARLAQEREAWSQKLQLDIDALTLASEQLSSKLQTDIEKLKQSIEQLKESNEQLKHELAHCLVYRLKQLAKILHHHFSRNKS